MHASRSQDLQQSSSISVFREAPVMMAGCRLVDVHGLPDPAHAALDWLLPRLPSDQQEQLLRAQVGGIVTL